MSRVLLDAENQITNGYRKNVHEAVDVVKKWYQADTIIAHSDGTVVLAVTGKKNNPGSTGNESYGNFVKIKHDDGYYTLYAHLKDVYVSKGQRVLRGEKIGYMGVLKWIIIIAAFILIIGLVFVVLDKFLARIKLRRNKKRRDSG